MSTNYWVDQYEGFSDPDSGGQFTESAAFFAGVKAGIEAAAWWECGEQFVGSPERRLISVISEIDEAEKQCE